jgi:hypothetical protein
MIRFDHSIKRPTAKAAARPHGYSELDSKHHEPHPMPGRYRKSFER